MLKVLELRMWSASLPGVATTTWGWLESSRAWLTMSVSEPSAPWISCLEPGLLLALSARTHSTYDDAVAQTQRLPQDSKLLCDLVCQFPASPHSNTHEISRLMSIIIWCQVHGDNMLNVVKLGLNVWVFHFKKHKQLIHCTSINFFTSRFWIYKLGLNWNEGK